MPRAMPRPYGGRTRVHRHARAIRHQLNAVRAERLALVCGDRRPMARRIRGGDDSAASDPQPRIARCLGCAVRRRRKAGWPASRRAMPATMPLQPAGYHSRASSHGRSAASHSRKPRSMPVRHRRPLDGRLGPTGREQARHNVASSARCVTAIWRAARGAGARPALDTGRDLGRPASAASTRSDR